jgi:hypothetical protein
MNRKFKILGFTFMAMALMAVMASAAQAQFTSSAAHTTYAGAQSTRHQYTAGTGIGAMDCTTASFSGTGSGTSAVASTIYPTYSGCRDSLGRNVHVTKNSLVGTSTSGAGKGLVHLDGEIILTVTTGFGHCTITLKAQNSVNGVTYTNESGKVKVTTHSNNVHSTIVGGGFACGTSSTTSTNGTYTGTTVIAGNGGAATISVD